MAHKQDKNIEKVMIVIWKWNGGKHPLPEGKLYDEWPVTVGFPYLLLRTDIHELDIVHSMVAEVVKRFQATSLLLFLHESKGHNFKKEDILFLKKHIVHPDFRIRLFGNLNGPIYFNAGSTAGFLGANGNFAPKFVYETMSNAKVWHRYGSSTENNQLKHECFTHVWNAYWHQPADVVYALQEDYAIWAPEYDLNKEPGESPYAYLKRQTDLFNKLTTFAGLADDFDPSTTEYDFTTYLLVLESGGQTETAAAIKQAQTDIRECLALEDGMPEKNLRDIYKTLRNLWETLAQTPPHA